MFSVYRINLAHGVQNCAKFLARNPHVRPNTTCFYVGSTALSVSERIRAHMTRAMGGHHIVRLFGLQDSEIRVSTHLNREEAEQAEKDHARFLVESGYGVWTNNKRRR